MQSALLLFCLLSPWREAANQQRETVACVESLGGRVFYDYERPLRDYPLLFKKNWKSPIPVVALHLLGRDFFHEVIRVDLSDTGVSDEDLVLVARLRAVEQLDLSTTTITNAGLANVETLGRLEFLDLANTAVDDAGLVHLRSFRNLKSLNLAGTAISDDGLVHLEELTSLDTLLCLQRTNVTNLGLEHLISLRRLASLALEETMVTREGVVLLQAAIPKAKISSDVTPRVGGFF